MNSSRSNSRFLFYLTGLTLAGFLLRINHTWSESITADEVSALLRLQFDSFGEMIENGVRPDGHPAFTQVLLWFWTKVFGDSEFSIRLPFVLMGTASIWFAGMASRRWFGIGTALAVAASIAFLQLPLMYSQLARPYAAGLFFTMWAACIASRFSLEEKIKWPYVIGFAVTAAGAAYSHYFSLLTTLLMGIAGIFLSAKVNRGKYLIAAVCAVLLFLPHIGITIAQLEKGGIGGPDGWLGEPTPDFFRDHIIVLFDASRGMTWLMLFIVAVCLVLNKRRPDKKQISVLLIWMVPLLTGYFYSIYVNPVLQHSVLLFSFPFFLMFVFSWFPNDEESKWPWRFGNAMIIILASYITLYKPFRLTDHFGRLKEIVDVYYETRNEYGTERVNAAFNVDDPYFLNYYARNYVAKGETPRLFTLEHEGQKTELAQLWYAVLHASGDYFIYGWSTRESSPASLDIIAETYPCLVEKHEWFNSAVYVFAKNRVSTKDCPYHSTILCYSFMNTRANDTLRSLWHPTCDQYGDHFTLDSSCQYGPMVRARVGDCMSNPDNEIILHASLYTPQIGTNAIFVVEYIRDGKQLCWTGMNTSDQLDMSSPGWQTAYFGQRAPIPLLKSDSIHAYVYSPDLRTIELRNVAFITRLGHKGIYGPRPDYE